MRNKGVVSCFVRCVMAGAVFLSMGFSSLAAPEYRGVDTSEKVYDYAGLLAESEADTLRETCEQLIAENGYDIFLLTIDENTVDYESRDRTLSFVEDFGDENGFGLGDDQDYVAFIIDMDERNFNIDVTGERCLKIFSTEIQESAKDRVTGDMRDGNYYGAMRQFLDTVEQCGSKEVSSFVGTEEEWQRHQQKNSVVHILFIILKALAIAAAAGGIIVFCQSAYHKTVHKAADAHAYIDESSFQATTSDDAFVRHYTTTRTIASSGSGGGSSGGGSHHTSTHSSSSGRSHGGGSSRGF